MRKLTIAVMTATTFFMLAPAAFSADETNATDAHHVFSSTGERSDAATAGQATDESTNVAPVTDTTNSERSADARGVDSAADTVSAGTGVPEPSAMDTASQTVTSTNADMTAVETAAPEADVIRGTVVSIDKSNNEIVVRDGATQADRRVAVDPNVMASTTLNVGDSVRVDLGGSPKQATSIRVTT